MLWFVNRTFFLKKKKKGRTPRYRKRAITIGQWLLRKLKIFQCIFYNIALGFSVIVSLINALVVCILAGTRGHCWSRWPPGHPWKIIIFLHEWKKKRPSISIGVEREKDGIAWGIILIFKLIYYYEFIHACWLIRLHHQGLNIYIKTEATERGYFNSK